MSELGEKLIKGLNECLEYEQGKRHDLRTFTEVVYCKDCKYRKSMYPEPLSDRCTYWKKAEHSIHNDDFCSRGKRNDTDNNYRSCGKRSVQHNKGFSEEKKMSGSAKHWALKEYKQRGEHLKRKEEMNDIYDNLTKEQLIGLQKQIRWERDVAIEQLHQIGKEFGEKMDDVHKVVFCKNCKYYQETHDMECYHDPWRPQYRDADDFCSKGERK